jgi:uncharacterized membrane protein
MSNLPTPTRVHGTDRLKSFSDGVIAIVITLLIFEVHVPTISDPSLPGVLAALAGIAPKLISFAVSFFTVAIFWVNHHHFYTRISHTDWILLWLNNLLLFWITAIPFTTAFIGDYPQVPAVVALYAFSLCLAGLSFTLMGYYVFFKSGLFPESVPMRARRREWARSFLGVALYATAGLLAFASVNAALIMLAVIPFLFVIPNLIGEN